MGTLRGRMPHGLTKKQAQLLNRYRNGVLRAALALSAKNGIGVADVMFVLADQRGRIGGTLRTALPVTSIGPALVPCRVGELSTWTEQLALHGPVWDCRTGQGEIVVIVVDEEDAMSVWSVSAVGGP
jgi:hypothetical protein